MKTLIVGDLHGDFSAFNALIASKNPEIVLQCGDFGYWPKEKPYDPALRIKPGQTKIFWCDGNHEDFSELARFRSDPPAGHEVGPGCFYQERGSTITLPDGRTVLFFGGAFSIDRDLGIEGRDWFPREVITEADLARLPVRPVDIVISHTAPARFGVRRFFQDKGHYLEKIAQPDPSETLLDVVFERMRPRLWYFGHWHRWTAGEHDGCAWTALSFAHRTGWWAWLPEASCT